MIQNPPTKVRDAGLIPGLRRFSGEGNDNLLQYSCLGSPMDRGTWQGEVRGVTKRVGHDLVTKKMSIQSRMEKEIVIFINRIPNSN